MPSLWDQGEGRSLLAEAEGYPVLQQQRDGLGETFFLNRDRKVVGIITLKGRQSRGARP